MHSNIKGQKFSFTVEINLVSTPNYHTPTDMYEKRQTHLE